MINPIRWTATVTYLGDDGPVDVPHDLTEIADLHDLVERGPDWRAITEIRIVPHETYLAAVPRVTVEQSRAE